MYKKMVELLKTEIYSIPSILVKYYRELDLSEKELIFILYIINGNYEFNINKITEELPFDNMEVMTLIGDLTEKNAISLTIENKKELFSVDELYNKLCLLVMDNSEKKSDIYSLIEREFGRTLSAFEYELAKGWLENGYEEEMIKEALKEAVYNQALNIQYIDTTLYNWEKKGYKKASDITNEPKKVEIKETFDYDWLSDDE